jgi:dTDP-glucose pyrophosphorylase/predicted transcriptional regulator
MKNIKKIKITTDATIKKALKVIEDGAIKIALVVDKRDKLIGTLSDGDIRRGFLKGLSISSSVKSLINKKPLVGKKNDIKEKLLNIAFSKKIHQIPIVDSKGKVTEILLTDELKKNEIKLNKVVIMAGGKGTRLRPLTKNTPKPMLKVGGKPILQTIIKRFSDCGFKDLIICVNYKSHIIENYFGNGDKFGVKIEYVKEKKRMGTAGALSFIKKKLTKPFFVINGDLLTNLDFEKMLDFHDKYNSNATMSVKDYNIVSPYGEVNLDGADIVSIEEKPKRKVFVNAGVYILDPKCINLIPKKFYDMPSLFKKIIAKKYKTVSFPLEEYWLDIGRFNDYKKANLEYNKEF